VVVVGLAIVGIEHWRPLRRVLQRLQDTSVMTRVRARLRGAHRLYRPCCQVGLETILGAFAAGALLSLIDRDELLTHPQFRVKLEAAGFGIFVPIFFVTSGLRFDLDALFASATTVARVPVFLLAIVAERGLPALA
jgi:hypothetical protein